MDGSAPLPAIAESCARAGGSVRSPIIEQIILEMLAERTPLSKICAALEIDDSTVTLWKRNDPDFAKRYEEARGKGYDRLADECLEIADHTANDTIIVDGFAKPNKEWIARSRVRIDTRLKLLACWDPGRYGAKLAVDAKVTSRNLTINATVDPIEAARQYQELMGD